MNDKLGKTQAMVLGALVEHRRWSGGCGWIWGGYRTTEKFMELLVAKGYAEKGETSYKYLGAMKTVAEYKPTQKGKDFVVANKGKC